MNFRQAQKASKVPASPKCPTLSRGRHLFRACALFGGKRIVIANKGKDGDANRAVIEALIEATRWSPAAGCATNIRIAGGRRRRVIFRNTPQWFVAIDKPFRSGLAARQHPPAGARAIDDTRWCPRAGAKPPRTR